MRTWRRLSLVAAASGFVAAAIVPLHAQQRVQIDLSSGYDTDQNMTMASCGQRAVRGLQSEGLSATEVHPGWGDWMGYAPGSTRAALVLCFPAPGGGTRVHFSCATQAPGNDSNAMCVRLGRVFWSGNNGLTDKAPRPTPEGPTVPPPVVQPPPVQLPSGGNSPWGAGTTQWWHSYGGMLTLTVSGDSVTGTYPGGGTLSGRVNGRVLQACYKESGSRGSVTFYLSPDGTRFDGNFIRNEGGRGNWCGNRNSDFNRDCVAGGPPTQVFSGC